MGLGPLKLLGGDSMTYLVISLCMEKFLMAGVVNNTSFDFGVFPLILITMQMYSLNCFGLSFRAGNKTPVLK